MTLFKRAAKPVCQEIVTATVTEVNERIETTTDDVGDILELGIMAVALVASFVVNRNPLVKAASLLLLPSGIRITEIGRF